MAGYTMKVLMATLIFQHINAVFLQKVKPAPEN